MDLSGSEFLAGVLIFPPLADAQMPIRFEWLRIAHLMPSGALGLIIWAARRPTRAIL